MEPAQEIGYDLFFLSLLLPIHNQFHVYISLLACCGTTSMCEKQLYGKVPQRFHLHYDILHVTLLGLSYPSRAATEDLVFHSFKYDRRLLSQSSGIHARLWEAAVKSSYMLYIR